MSYRPPAARTVPKNRVTQKLVRRASLQTQIHHWLQFTCAIRRMEVSPALRNCTSSKGQTSKRDGAEADEFNEYSMLSSVDLIDEPLSEIRTRATPLSRLGEWSIFMDQARFLFS